MAFQTKSAVFAVKEETTEGTLEPIASGSDFTVLREGFSFEASVETVDTDELINSIGATKSLLAKETPAGSIPKYFKHSGTEGQAPDYSIMIESAMAGKTVNSTEYDTVAASTAGDDNTRAAIKVDAAEGTNFAKGQALLIKDAVNNYSIRNIYDISTDDLNLNFNLPSAPALGVNLGKAVHYFPEATGHPTFSAYLFQAAASTSAYAQAQAGCRTTNMAIEFPANDLAAITFDFEGIEFFIDPVTIDATNDDIDFDDGGGEINVSVEQKVYKTPKDLATAIAAAMNAGTSDTITVGYSSLTGKFTITSDGATLSLLWLTGTNTATTIGDDIGFDTAADDTAALTYTSDNAQDFSAPFTPVFDDVNPNVVRNNELILGDFFRADCRKGSNASLTISTPKTDVDDFCSVSGVSESITLEREATFSATLVLQQYDVDEFDKLLNNGELSVMFNHGPKDGSNWIPGQCVNVYIPAASVTSNVISDSDGIQIVEFEAKAFVSSTQKDVHINFL